MPAQGESPDTVFRDPDAVRAVYGRSIEYSLSSLVSFVRTYPDPNLVLVVLGDHQPHTYVTGHGVGHDVPISIDRPRPAGDEADLRVGLAGRDCGRIRQAPVWPMDAFRDRFLTAFTGSAGAPRG